MRGFLIRDPEVYLNFGLGLKFLLRSMCSDPLSQFLAPTIAGLEYPTTYFAGSDSEIGALFNFYIHLEIRESWTWGRVCINQKSWHQSTCSPVTGFHVCQSLCSGKSCAGSCCTAYYLVYLHTHDLNERYLQYHWEPTHARVMEAAVATIWIPDSPPLIRPVDHYKMPGPTKLPNFID